ncbi:MAG: TonB-dependent receptor, partial [Bacteroidetes bacterium]
IYRMPNQTSQVVAALYPNGFLPLINSNIVDKSFSLGIRGKIQDWNVDFSNTYGTNSFMFGVENSNNASLGTESPTSFQCGGFAFTQNTTNFDMNKYFDKVLSGFNVAFGAEFRVDNYEIFAGEEKSYRNYGLRDIVNVKTVTRPDGTSFNYNEVVGQFDALGKVGGAQVFPGFKPSNEVNKYRTNAAAYLDLEADITKKFTIGAAARYENYSDFGSTLNGKLTARVVLAEGYSLRGAVSTGFRAPSLQQSYFSAVSTLFIGGAPFETGTFTNDSRAAQILGIPKLKQETSVNASLGITAEPVKGLTLSVDGYYIKINDRVVLTGQFRGNAAAAVGTQDRTINDLLFSVGANTGQFFTNAINTTTMGLDVVAAQKFDIGKGNLDVSLAANFNKTTVGDDIKTTDLLKGKEANYFDREQRAVFETGNPQNKVNLTLTYKINKFSIMVRNVRFGEITYRHPSDGGDPSAFVLNNFTGQKETRDQTFSAKMVTDITLSYQIAKNLGLTIGANNLLDVYPDRNAHSDNASSGRFPYSRRITQFGFNGAYYFGRLSFSL